MYAMKQALREEIARFPALLEKEYEALRSPLKVWLYFTARDGIGAFGALEETDDYVQDRDEIKGKYTGQGRHYQYQNMVEELLSRHLPIQVLLQETAMLWWCAATGYDATGEDHWEGSLKAEIQIPSEALGTPPILREQIHTALHYYVRRIRTLRDHMLTVDVKQAVYDALLYRAAVDQPPPNTEDFLDTYREESSKRGRPYDFPIEDTERWLNELTQQKEYQGYGSKSKIIAEIERRHHKKQRSLSDDERLALRLPDVFTWEDIAALKSVHRSRAYDIQKRLVAQGLARDHAQRGKYEKTFHWTNRTVKVR